MEIKVRIESQYGNKRVFPVCEKAILFASIAGMSTLIPSVLEAIKKLGYIVTVVPESI